MDFEQARKGESTRHNLAYKGRFAVGVPMNDREALEAFSRGEKKLWSREQIGLEASNRGGNYPGNCRCPCFAVTSGFAVGVSGL